MIQWSFRCYSAESGPAISASGVAEDRPAALAAILAERQWRFPPASAPPRGEDGTVVTCHGEKGVVRGFFDAALGEAEVVGRIEAAFAYVRTDGMATAPGSVAEQWRRIEAWLAANVGPSPFAGAAPERVAAAEAATGVPWPAELVELYGLIDGSTYMPVGALLPTYEFLSLDEMLDTRRVATSVWSGTRETFGIEDEDISQAGQIAWTFLPEYLPFAGLDSYELVVDTRPGELFGCVTAFDKVGADSGGPLWRSLSAMLTDLADSLETGEPFNESWRPGIVDGRLEWRYAP